MATIKSIEEKAKAYDEAIEALRSLFAEQAIKHCDRVNIKDITNIFSELKESEDERIREDIISHFARRIEGSSFDEVREKYKIWISWLEKQGEQKPAEEYNITGIGSKNAQGKLGEMIKNLKPVNEVLEQKSAELSEEIPTDLKDIVDKEANAIWKEESSDGCHLVIDSFNMFYGICMQIAEAVVDYKKPVEWSEEDEKKVAVLEAYIRSRDWSDRHIDRAFGIVDELVNKVKSLKERYAWKPSDEQMEAVRLAAEIGTANNSWAMGILKSMYQDLKKLRKE